MVVNDTFSKLLVRWRTITGAAQQALSRVPPAELGARERALVRAEMSACIESRGGDVASRARAAGLGKMYDQLNRDGRAQFLSVLAEFAPERATIAEITARLAATTDADAFARAAHDLRVALEPPAIAVFKQFNSLPSGIKFLVDLRADLLDLRDDYPELARLERDLRELLASWFDVGFLALRRITWDAPASLLQRLAEYEAVHEVRNWRDLKNRLDTDRRCYAFFHPLMPEEPLIFIEIALTSEMASGIAPLLDTAAPVEDPERATTAIFYSISNCQRGLSGISFGNALIKRVVADLAREYPQLKTFVTLSPVPGFMNWLRKHKAVDPTLLEALDQRAWYRDPTTTAAVRGSLVRLCAHYLLDEKRRDGTALDPVAHFHLSNGARVERINWLGDTSVRGLRDAAGFMVNYLYQRERIDEHHEAYAGGSVAHAPAIKALVSGKS